MDQNTLILIPAFNEEKNIKQVISGIKQLWPETHILVVNDGSRDDTASVALKIGGEVISLPFNLGYGVALQTGYKYAINKDYKYLIQMDGDGQHDPAYIDDLLKVVTLNEADVAIGSRFSSEEKRGTYRAGFFKKIGMKLFGLITSILIGQKVTDPTTGYQAMNRRVLEFFVSDIYPVDFPDADVLIMLHRAGFRIREVPVAMHQSVNNRSMHRGLVPLYYVFKMFLSIFVELLRKMPRREVQ
ncbi:MAG: glycosyltransferase family 2 protein [Proteobacteria bacterium]|nr:glycosyltransferase family 2 protein [Pseudomonadota bacterium]